MSFGNPSEKVIQASRDVCHEIEKFSGLEVTPLLLALVRLLEVLIPLPPCPVGDDDADFAIPHGHSKGLGNLPDEVFHEIFDPTDPSSISATSLGDCLRDIYDSLKGGLIAMDEQPHKLHSIMWEWQNEFNFHWGRHLVDVIRYLVLIKNGVSSQKLL